MKKAFLLIFLLIFYLPVFAMEQNFQIENNLDINTLKIEEDKYVEVINSIVEDVMENGIYFTMGNKEILPDGVNYRYQVNNVKALLKKDVFKRNVEKAKIFKSKSLLYRAILRSNNIDSDRKAWISNGYSSQTCFTFNLLNKNKEIIGKPTNLENKIMLTIYNFVENDVKSAGYITDPQYLQKLINDPTDILLAERNVYKKVNIEQLAQIGEISLKTEPCQLQYYFN